MDKNKIEKDSYIYNSISGLLNAFQSVLILMVLTRTLGVEAAGIFTIGYSIANLMLNIGKFGMRNFQATDVTGRYSYQEYFVSRLITTVFMMVISLLYVIIVSYSVGYSVNKSLIILMTCVWKCVDSLEDVVQGDLQKNGRLDLGAKEFTYRQVISILVFLIACLLVDDLLWATTVTALASMVAAFILLKYYRKLYKKHIGLTENGRLKTGKVLWAKVWSLMQKCIPLFISSFLAFYLVNASKYAIDANMDEISQAKFGFISMPVFVVGLLAQFIYMPIIRDLALSYASENIKGFRKEVKKQIMYVLLITLVVLLGGYMLGIPVLSALYGVDLSSLKMELMILLVGSGLLAYGGLMLTILTVMGHNRRSMAAYGGGGAVALCTAFLFTKRYELLGASWSLMLSVLILAIIITFAYWNVIANRKKCN